MTLPVGVGTRSWQAPPYHGRARHGGAPEGGASSRPLGTGIHDHTACGDIERCEHLSPIRAGWSFQQAMSRDGDRVAHRSVRPCQYAPSCMRSYSSRLTQGSNVVASMCGRPAASTSGTEHTPYTGTAPRSGHGGVGLTGVVVRHPGRSCHIGRSYHGALAAAAVGGEHEPRDGGDERIEQGPRPDQRQTPAVQHTGASVSVRPGSATATAG